MRKCYISLKVLSYTQIHRSLITINNEKFEENIWHIYTIKLELKKKKKIKLIKALSFWI